MTEQKFLSLMNEDLKREYQHMLFYLHSSAIVTGFNRHEISEFLFDEAQGELKHVREFTDQILAHGGTPHFPLQLTDNLPNYFTGDVRSILSFVLQMESDVVNIFAERLKQTEEIDSPFGQLLHIFYEDQITDSHKTVHEVRMLLKRT